MPSRIHVSFIAGTSMFDRIWGPCTTSEQWVKIVHVATSVTELVVGDLNQVSRQVLESVPGP